MSLVLTLTERAHAQHVALRVLAPRCPLCDAIVAQRPEWVQRLAQNAREFETRRPVA